MPSYCLSKPVHNFFVIVLLFLYCGASLTEVSNLKLDTKQLKNSSNITKTCLHCVKHKFPQAISRMSNNTQTSDLFNEMLVFNDKRLKQHLYKIKNGGNYLLKMTYNNVVQSIIDLMIFWKRKNAIFLVDNYSDIIVNQLKKYMDLSLYSYGAKVIFDVIAINEKFNLTKIMTYDIRTLINFVLICRENIMQKIIEMAKFNGLFTSNNTWIIANHRIPEIFVSTIISVESLVTVIVYDSSSHDSQKSVSKSISTNVNLKKNLKPNNIEFKNSTDFRPKAEDLHWQELSIATNICIYDVFHVIQHNKTEFIKFANWSPQQGLRVFEFFEENDNLQKLRGRGVRVPGFVHMPYVKVDRHDDGSVKFTGYMTEIIQMLVMYFNANATYIALEPHWGILFNGTYTGLLNRLHNKEFEISMNGFSIVPDRVPVLNFLAPLTKVDWSLGYKMPMSTVPPTTYLYPFSLEVWIFIFIILIILAIVLALVMLWSPGWANSDIPSLKVHSKKFRILTWTYLDEVLENPPGISARLIFGTVLLGVLMSFIFYTSVFTSFLAYKDIKLPIRSMEDLVDDKDYRCVVVRNTIYEDMPRRSRSGLFKQLWDNKMKWTEEFSMGKSIYDGIQKMLRGKTVFACDAATIIVNMNNDCSVTVISTAMIRENLYLVTRSDFPYSRIFYIRMLRIKEGGIMSRLGKVHHTGSRPPCDSGMDNGSSSFGIEQVVGLFFMLFCGIILSFIAMAVEFCIDVKVKRRRYPH